MKQINFKFRVVLSLLLVFFCSSLWGAKNSTYKIVNNSGEVVFHVKGTTDNPQLPAKAQSPFATNYRYYRYLEDAKLDASSGAEAAASKRLTGNLTYDGEVFVRYSYEPNGNVKDHDGKTLRIDGNAVYNFTICDYTGGTDASKKQPIAGTPGGRYVYYNSSSVIHHSSLPAGIYEKIHIAPYNKTNTEVTGAPDEATKKTKEYQWRFVGQRNGYEGAQGLPDPYDIRIINVADNSKVLTGIYTRTYDQGPTTQQYIHLTLLAPDNDATHVQRFFIRKLSNTVQIAACAPLYLYLGGTTQKDMWFVLNKEPNEYLWTSDANSFKEHDCFQTLHMRIHTKQEDAGKIDGGSERRSALKFYRLTTRKYIILDGAGNKLAAANATADEMDQRQVPASIASALPGVTYRYWKDKAMKAEDELKTADNLPDVIYVTYTYDKTENDSQVKLDGTSSYKMRLNGNYVKYQVNSGDDSDVNIGTEEASDADEYAWKFEGDDPYHIQLTCDKTGAGYITGESTGTTISLHTGNKTAALVKNVEASGRTPSTYYLVKSPAYTNENPVYLLRASYVGEGASNDDADDDPNFYTWAYGGDASDWNESRPRLYSSAFIEDADEALQMQLEELLAKPGATYHIVDLSDKEVISANSRSIKLEVPASIKSPLATNFRYYDTFENAKTDNKSTGIVTTVASGDNIYVTYDAGTEIKINTVDTGGLNERYRDRGDDKDALRIGTFYVLKFLNGKSYYHEDGSNGITTDLKKSQVPYSNGDACMNVYDEEFTDAKLNKGGNERTRMPWAFIGGDPYRLKISSYQDSHKKLKDGATTKKISKDDYDLYFSYFRTYYNERLDKVITTNVTDDPLVTTDPQYGDANAKATEYMILGTKGKYKLVTTETIDDGTTDEHRTVNSFEQYWKNNETIGRLFGTYEPCKDSNGKDQYYITSMPSDAELIARGWHKYPAWAYAKPADGTQDKEYDYLTHWFQTFEMGEEFDLIETTMSPSLVLLDNHGWEVFRHPMPTSKTSTDEKEVAKTNFIKSYDSPMVKAYHWYKKGEKLSGFHKYRAYDPALAESGEEEFTSTTLTDYPPEYATNPGDWYVTYEVKDEYKYLYDDNNGSPISAPCLIGNSSVWAKANGSAITTDNTVSVSGDATNLNITGTIDNDMLWYMKPNSTIDTEMGYSGSAITYNSQQKGFDPYNIQVRNKDDKYFQTNAADAVFNDQEWTSTTGTTVSLSSTAATFTAKGADNVTVHPTNFTFMALKDVDGYVRLVPRFDHMKAITDLNTLTEWNWETPTTATTQGIRIQPIQQYQFEVRDANSNTLVASSSVFYAAPGTSLYTKLGDVSIPLPRDLIRSYCDYPAAYTSYTSETNTYANAVTTYPLGDGTGINSEGVKIYVPFYPTQGLFSSVETPSWYNISFENKNQFIQANTSTHAVSGGGVQTNEASKWAFVGSPYELRVFNQAEKAAGGSTKYLAMKSDGSAVQMTESTDSTSWTLLYNNNGDPIMRLKNHGVYIKKNGAGEAVADYPNGNVYKIFLTNLVTVTYHVCHGTFGTPSSWTEDYTESFDYEVSQLEDYPGLPETVALPLCEYKYFKTGEAMQAGTEVTIHDSTTGEDVTTIGYPTFSALYTALTPTEKISNMDIYLSYDVHYNDASVPIKFFATEAEARASMKWSFLMQGVESAAIVYGTQNKDYGHENARMGKTARTYGSDIASLTSAERTFTQHSDIPVMGGFHFIRRTSALQVDAATGAMTVPETNDSIGLEIGARYIPSQNAEVNASLMSPLNDFRRIAETYKDGKDTKFRENSWLWAFIGTPYKFEIINREALVGASYDENNMPPTTGGTYKRLAQVVEKGTPYLKLVTDTVGKKIYWTLEQLDNYGDDETKFSFHIKSYDENKIMSRTSATTSTMRTINTPPISDIAYLKSTAFMVYPWNWDDNKYKKVTVNIYKGSVSGSPVLTKTFEPADRAFMAGDVIDGTSGHFYLPLDGKEDGSWKEKGVVNKTMPYDGHKINIPYEMRRRACIYTVVGSGPGYSTIDGRTAYTVQESGDQTINITYTVPPQPYAPLFVAENEWGTFRDLGDNDIFHDVKKSDYYYYVDVKNDLSQHAYVKDDLTGASSDTRFAAGTPDNAKFYIVGDPYNVRLCNVYTDKQDDVAKNLARNSDGTTSMSTDDFYWEVVDASSEGSHSYDGKSNNVKYRLDYLGGSGSKALALRTKSDGDATKYYFGKDGKTYANSIYTSEGTPQLNKLAAFRDYPDSRHSANTSEVTVSVMRPVSIQLSVYDQDEPTKLVTKNEQSDYYALTERFKGVPSNLQRNHCKYTWVSTDTKQSATNNKLTEDGYFVISDAVVSGRSLNLYAKYEETDDSPFCTLDENGNPVLKKHPSNSPWYNMNIGTRWAFFNSNRVGKRYEINGKTDFNATFVNNATEANNLNNSELTFPYAGSSLPKATLSDRFHKGLHWALVGDPYNFQIRCQRDIIELTGEGTARTQAVDEASGNYTYYPAYIKGAPTNDETGTVVPSIAKENEATWWTWIRERSSNRYFLSESWTRRTDVTTAAAASAKKYGPRRLPINYPQPDPSVDPSSGTLNFKIGDEAFQTIANNQGVIARGDSYGIGDEMKLLSVNDVDANNECFDAIVTVYNKVNEPVATEGWTELVRENAKGNGRIPTEVQRWGCTYHYWADETMTRYPFKTFNQKDENGNYLIQDKGTVYVTYDYDESLYSSETEYRWLNPFYNWNGDPATQMAWINSPANSDTKDKDKAWADEATQSTAKDQKWVMIGDPYKFILYNYNRKKDADAHNAYYLYYDGTKIRNKNFTGEDEFNETTNKKETKQGIYYTWKVDGTSFGFTNDNGETFEKLANLPESFYNFNGVGANKVQTGYLAICDMTKTSLTDNANLLGSIVGYTTFDNTDTDKYVTKTASAAKRYLVMPQQQKAATVTFHLDPTGHSASKRDWTNNPVFDYTTTDFGVDNTISLPWMMRRQYCDYKFYVVNEDGADPATSSMVDALNYTNSSASPITHKEGVTRDATYTEFWKDGVDNLTKLSSMDIPDSWNGKHVYIRVTYQPTEDFLNLNSTSNDGSIGENKTVRWLNIANQEKGNMLQYMRSQKVIGNSKENGANVTNDYLWAVEGDPYGFKLHNRYAVHGFNGTLNENWTNVLTTDKVNSTENYNYSLENNPNFTFDANGDPVKKSDITYGAKGTADAYGTMIVPVENETPKNYVYEAMTGNYDGAMLIHPVNACINVRHDNGMKYFGAFLFNGAATDYPVQLNYLQEWEAMRNVYANWRLEKPTVDQLYPYYERAGFVGGLTIAAATTNASIFGKIKNKEALSDSDYNTAWALVHNPANLVQFTSGAHYRLRAYSSFDDNDQVQEQLGGHYVSGFLHTLEKDYEGEYRIPLHFYERAGASSNIKDLGFLYGNEWSEGVTNVNLLEIPDPEFDPSSIFRITKESNESPYVRFETQGLVINGEKDGMTLIDMPTGDDLEAKNGTLYFEMQDIGQTAFQIRAKDNAQGENVSDSQYLTYSPDAENKYMFYNSDTELNVFKGVHDTHIHGTKWLLEPVGSSTDNQNAAGVTFRRPLRLKVNKGGDGNYYSTMYLPFNVTLPTGVVASVGRTLNIEAVEGGNNHYRGTFAMKDVEGPINAGTPALIKTTQDYVTNGQIELTIPDGVTWNSDANPLLSGTYLNKTLPSLTDNEKYVMVFGQARGVPGFYKNSAKDYDGKANNRFVGHNKLYFILTSDQATALSQGKAITFDIFGDETATDIDKVDTDNGNRPDDDTVYDLLGRKVEHINRPGIYIRNGKKFVVK